MKKIRLLFVLSLVICAVVCGIIFNNASVSVSNVSNIDVTCEEYTSSMTPNGINIYDYVNEFKARTNDSKYTSLWTYPRLPVPKGNYFQNNNIFEKAANRSVFVIIDEDDNITKIVPKELFTSIGEKLYIGNCYGFYINTFQRAGKNYLESTVILIDVIKIVQADYSFDVKIQPLAKIDYSYITISNSSIEFKNEKNENYNGFADNFVSFNGNVTNAVIPMIRNDIDANPTVYYMKYKESENFSLSDISFVSSVYNCNSLNYGDAGYNANNDNGYFFNGATYEYSATKKTNGGTQLNVNEIGDILLDKVLGKVPVVGGYYTFLNYVTKGISAVNSSSTQITYNTTNKNYYCPDTVLPPTKEGQINEYGDLIKYLQMIINSDENNKLLFANDDYAKGTFNLSKTNGSNEYSILNISIALKVVNNNPSVIPTSNDISCVVANTIVFEINQPQPKNINAFENINYYVLPNFYQKFVITPIESSNYILSINDSNIELKLNGQAVNSQNGDFILKMLKNQTYTVELINNSAGVKSGTFALDCPNALTPFELLAGEELMFKLNSPKNVAFKISTANSNISFKLLDENFNILASSTTNELHEYLKILDQYYLLVNNKSSSSQNCTIATEEAEELVEGFHYTLTGINEYRYVKFVPTESENYAISIEGFTSLMLQTYGIYNGTETSETGSYVITTFLSAGEEIYLGHKGSGIYTIKIEKVETALIWEVNGVDVSEGSIWIPRGTQSEIRLKIGSTYFNGKLNPSSGSYFSFTNNTLNIQNNCYISNTDHDYISITASIDNELYIFRVFVGHNLNINFDIYNNQSPDYGFTWQKFSSISSTIDIYYHVEAGFKTSVTKVLTGKNATLASSQSILSIIKNELNLSGQVQAQIIIEKLVLTDNGRIINIYNTQWSGFANLTEFAKNQNITPNPIILNTYLIFNEIGGGSSHSLSIDSNGNLWAWGSNIYGQLGNDTTENSLVPIQVMAGTKFKEASAGRSFSLAIDTSGNLWAWGSNFGGQLGDGSTINRSLPVQIKSGTKFIKISAGAYHSLAIDTSNNLWAWGENFYGQLGNGTTIDKSLPVQIKSGTKFAKISAGYGHSLAIDSNNLLWAWGCNMDGQLGDGTTTHRNSPVQIKAKMFILIITITTTEFAQISAGFSHSLAIDKNGNLWAWGCNGQGRLGDGTTTYRNSPVQIKFGTTFKEVSAGNSHSLAIDSNNLLWAWGYNSNGRLGDGTTTQRNSPVQIKASNGTVTQFKQIGAGEDHSLAIDMNGNLWAWGINNQGRLGDGTTTNRLSPVRIIHYQPVN